MILAWFRRRANERRRRIDIEILGPSLRRNAPNLQIARLAFRQHTNLDHAWTDLSDAEIDKIVDNLK